MNVLLVLSILQYLIAQDYLRPAELPSFFTLYVIAEQKTEFVPFCLEGIDQASRKDPPRSQRYADQSR